ncbi:DUF2793 domain-containing protein [Methylobacterium phyllosphaerae]
MSDATPHLGLPLIAASQAQKHVTHNEALDRLDALVQLACLDKDLAAPPPSPAEGDRYLVVASEPGGAWVGLAGQVVRYADGVWTGAVPRAGWLAYLIDEADLYVFDGAAWTSFRRTLTAIQSVDRLGINTGADATNRLALKADAALLTWDDATPGSGDMRVFVNRKAAACDAALVFETGYTARALLGTLGSDDFTLKVSADGSAFATALTASAKTGGIDFASAEAVLDAAPTTDLGATGTRRVLVTGAARITSFGRAADRERFVRFAGAATLVHAAGTLALPTRADLVTAPDDTCIATSDAAGRWRVRHYQRADGTPLAIGAQTLGANGSVQLPGGLTLQWGLVIGADAEVAVTFDRAFPSACLGVWTQPATAAGDALHAAQVSDVAATGFTLRSRRAAAGTVTGAGSVPTYWLALGM